jgi:hypothetical protein
MLYNIKNAKEDILKNELFLLNMGILPSVFFRFPGLVYNNDINQCVIPSSTPNNVSTNQNSTNQTTESFVNDILTQKLNTYKKPDVMIGSEGIKPNNSNLFINYGKL